MKAPSPPAAQDSEPFCCCQSGPMGKPTPQARASPALFAEHLAGGPMRAAEGSLGPS